MKATRLLILLSLAAISACAVSQKEISVEPDFLPGWELGYEHLDIVGMALAQQDDARQYALHSVGDPILTANIIVKTWQFSWQGAEYEIVESDNFTKVVREGAEPVHYGSLNYTIYSADGTFVMELEKTESTEGDVQFLVRSAGNGVAVKALRSGQPTGKIYDELSAPYGCSKPKLRSLAHGEEFTYYAFGIDSLSIAKIRNKATLENGILKIMSKQIHGARTEMRLNQDMEVIYMGSEGLVFETCDVGTARGER